MIPLQCNKNGGALVLEMGVDSLGASSVAPESPGNSSHGRESGRLRLRVDHGVEITVASWARVGPRFPQEKVEWTGNS